MSDKVFELLKALHGQADAWVKLAWQMNPNDPFVTALSLLDTCLAIWLTLHQPKK
ncbi:hypothetical protein [Lactobacillus sp. ESL0681]|uniref:hypothetical protein n=1 Tax=Lactobacillus sp. ESL0681 TaxID=2983211 RepID=UPI0023F8A3A4|nr:hypothetical protein [Lactobacillus sp. ESL0681]WEV40087.1 hypothetical protein OZX59_07725 [Lactobacillus sp. ESL0681]